MESRRTSGAEILNPHEAMLATCMSLGFALDFVSHGVAVVDAFVYGFALQEAALPFSGGDGDLTEISEQVVEPLSPENYPALTRFTAEHVMQPGYDYGDSFDEGLDYVLEGVERRARAIRR